MAMTIENYEIYAEIAFKSADGDIRLKIIEHELFHGLYDKEKVKQFILNTCTPFIKNNYTGMQWEAKPSWRHRR